MKQRAAVKRTVVEQGNSKRYDVEMIRDFLDHLLLELRVHHFELLKNLKNYSTTDDLDTLAKMMENQTSVSLVEQFLPFQKKYQSALIRVNAYDKKNASDAEVKAVITTVTKRTLANRDKQIGNLEALKDLFDEALECAKMQFGTDQDGNTVQPIMLYIVRKIADNAGLLRD